MLIAWSTDTHLDFCHRHHPEQYASWVQALKDSGAHIILLTGDISTGLEVREHLDRLHADTGMLIYFVLGNHDYYGSSFADVREAFKTEHPGQKWLTSGWYLVTPDLTLIGHDGWYDSKNGDPGHVLLNDFHEISELKWANPWKLSAVLNRLGEESAEQVLDMLDKATTNKVVIATHVPPFVEAAKHQGNPTGAQYLPYFTNRSLGDALRTYAKDHPEKQLLVLAGHTHSPGEAVILPNLRIRVGGAAYGKPRILDVLDTQTLFT